MADRRRSWFGSLAPTEWLRAHPFAADWILALSLFALIEAGTLMSNMDRIHNVRSPDVWATVFIALSTIPLAWRRTAPRLVLLIVILAEIPLLVLNYPTDQSGLGVLLAMYTVAVHCERRQAFLAFGWSMALTLPVFIAGMFSSDVMLSPTVIVANVLIFATAFILGDAVRSRRQLLVELEFRADTAERQKAEEAQRAVDAERARIAREMHDIVAHAMSVMVVQAGAARRVLDQQPDKAAEAMANIESTGRDAMADMRRLLGVLRDESGSAPALAPQPGLDDVPSLIERWRGAGLEVTYRTSGTARPLAQGADTTAYRIIQESLTNVSKHAGVAMAEASVAFEPDAVIIDVRDDGRGAASDRPSTPGHGLVGMRERLSLFGGTVEARPRASGGFVVHAVLPTGPSGPTSSAVPSDVAAPASAAPTGATDDGAARSASPTTTG